MKILLIFSKKSRKQCDTGTKQDAAHILEVMETNNIKKPDDLILSHGDADMRETGRKQ